MNLREKQVDELLKRGRIGNVDSVMCNSENNTFINLNIDDTLKERGSRYGKFTGHSEITQSLKRLISSELNKRQKKLSDDQQEAMDMIAHKIGRIINGDPDYVDSWIDIAGYAKLVADNLESNLK